MRPFTGLGGRLAGLSSDIDRDPDDTEGKQQGRRHESPHCSCHRAHSLLLAKRVMAYMASWDGTPGQVYVGTKQDAL
jgi:hypothetical protein